jgi:hypothetical protein
MHLRLLEHAVPRLRPLPDGVEQESIALQLDLPIRRTWHMTVGRMHEVHAGGEGGAKGEAGAGSAGGEEGAGAEEQREGEAQAGGKVQEEADAGGAADEANASAWFVLANAELLEYGAPGLHGLGEASASMRVVRWSVAWRESALTDLHRDGLEAFYAVGLQFTLTDELGGERTLRAASDRAAWVWLATLARLPTHNTAPTNLMHSGAGWAVAEMLWAHPVHFGSVLGLLIAEQLALLSAWLLSSIFVLGACCWVVGWWSWVSMAELCVVSLCLDADAALLTVQACLGVAIAVEAGARYGRRRAAPHNNNNNNDNNDNNANANAEALIRPPALLDTLHDRLLRQSGAVFTLLTLGSLFTAGGLGDTFSWHMQYQVALACLREFRRTRDELRLWGARPGAPRGTALRRFCAWYARAAWRGTKRVLALGGVVCALLLLRVAGHLLWAVAVHLLLAAGTLLGRLALWLAPLLGRLEAATAAAAAGLRRLPGGGALCDGARRLYALRPSSSGVFELLGTGLLVRNAWRVAQFALRFLPAVRPPDNDPFAQRRPWRERLWCGGFVGSVCLWYFLRLEPQGMARARLRETMLVVELALPWVEVQGLAQLRRQLMEAGRGWVRRLSRRSVARRQPELGDTCAICCEPLLECTLRLTLRRAAAAPPPAAPPPLAAGQWSFVAGGGDGDDAPRGRTTSSVPSGPPYHAEVRRDSPFATVTSAQATLQRLEAERDELLAERDREGASDLESRLRAVEGRLREQLAAERSERSAAAAEARASSHGAAADFASGCSGGAEGASTAAAAGRLSLCCGGVEFSAPTSPTAPVASAGGGEMQPPVRAEVALVAQPLDYCRWGCGRAVHMQCSLEWRAHRNECVFCGAFWD